MNLSKYIKSKTFLSLIVLIATASILRLWLLGSVPYGFANDEVSYILSGYSIASTNGYDITGKFFPLSVNLDSSLSPVPVYIIVFFVKLIGLTRFVARLPFALLGIGIVIIVFYIAKELFKKEKIAFFSSMFVALSSWSNLITRGAWDVVPAQFFYLLGILVFLKKVKNGGILWSLPFYLLGFFSYHGTKVFFAFFAILSICVFWKSLLQRKKELVLFVGGLILIFVLFGIVTITQSVTRQSELIFSNADFIKSASKQIDFERDKSTAPLFLKRLVSNKLSYFVGQIAEKYLVAFSPNFLLITGDIQPIYGYGIFFKGVIYYPDLIFGVIGIFCLIFISFGYKKDHIDKYKITAGSVFILGSLLLSPLPSTFGSGNSYIIRSFMMVPFIGIIVGVGAYFLYSYFKKKGFVGILLIGVAILIYCLFVFSFLYQYYYQFNYYGSEFWNGSSRFLSQYIIKNYNKYDRIIVVTSEDKVFLQYAFASKATPKEISTAWEKNWPVKFGKVSFSNSCFNNSNFNKLSGRVLYIAHPDCKTSLRKIHSISDPLERLRVIWRIYAI